MTPWPTLALVLLPWNEAPLAQFVTVQLGELPIIISAPHRSSSHSSDDI
ncbi:MAG: hypothetical protein ACRCZF_04810 [Gemmataceae bacterium]